MPECSTEDKLETPQELADRVGVPVSAIRKLIREKRIEHIFLTSEARKAKIPYGAWDRYIAQNIIHPIRGEKAND